MTSSSDIQAVIEQTVQEFGRLVIAFNNAGIEQAPAPLIDIAEDEWSRLLDIDLRNAFLCMKYEILAMLEHGGGSIVNTSSGAGVVGIRDQAAYVAAKHELIGLAKIGGAGLCRAGRQSRRDLPGHHRDAGLSGKRLI